MKTTLLSAIAISAALLTGCETPQATAPRTTKITCRVPKIVALPETKEAQEKGGIEISLVPALYKANRSDRVTIRQAQPGMGVMLLGPSSPDKVYVMRTSSPKLTTQPDRLQFSIRINNKLSRVFRGQGAVVQFNVGGKLIPFGNTDYKDFLNGIVPPRNEAEMVIYGPTIDMLPAQGTLGIFLYDVVTATDAAGNVTEKQDFEWYFNCTMETAEETGEVKVTEGWISAEEYQKIMNEQQLRLQQRRMANPTP